MNASVEDVSPEPGETERASLRKRQRGSWASRLNAQLEDFPLELVTQGLCIVIVMSSLFAIGGVHPMTTLALGLASTLLAFFAIALRATDRRLPLAPPVFVFWALVGACVVQLVPLPMSVLKVVSPTAADIWSRALSPLGEPGPSLAPLSLDPGATALEALRWFSYAAVFVGSAAISTRVGVRWAATTIFCTASVAALLTIGHGLIGADKVYGLYTPGFKADAGWHVGPLLNPNNLAGYLNLGTLAGFGLLFDEDSTFPRWLNALGVAVLVGVLVVTASRGGVVMFLTGVAMLVVALERSRARRAESRASARQSRALLLGTVVFGALLAFLGSQTKTWRELFDENLGKLAMTSWVRPVIGDFAWFGVGRGAFESVFPAYQPGSGGTVFTHVENFPAQWIVEWGIVVGVGALFALGWLFRPSKLAITRTSAAAGAYCGAVTLLLQNLADLGLEIPALCFALALLLGALWGTAAQKVPSLVGPVRHAPSAIRLATGVAVVGVLLSVGVAKAGMRPLDGARHHAREALLARKAPRTLAERRQVRSTLREAMRRHPAEPYFPLLGAVLAWQEQDESAIPWLQRSLERSRANGRAHLLLAQVLEHRKAKLQALMELRLALSIDPSLIDDAATFAASWADDEDQLARVVPSGELAGKTWAAIGARMKDEALAARCDRRALELDESLIGPRTRLVLARIAERRRGTRCVDDEAQCASEIEGHARLIEQHAPKSSAGGQLRARWLAAIGKAPEASLLLLDLCDTVEDRIPCLRTRVQLAAEDKAPDPLIAAERSLVAAVCMEERECAATSEWIGGLHAERNEWGAAASFYGRSVQHEETDARLEKLANASNRAGMSAQALRTLERVLAKRGGHDHPLETRIRDLRKQVMDGVLR